jgi:hypothetical protein
MNMAYVASRFHASRRREGLSWSHHAEVASLQFDEQEMWLQHAAEMKLSVRGLREELRASRSRQSDRSDRGGAATSPTTAAAAMSTFSLGATIPGNDTPEADDMMVCPQCGYHLVGTNELPNPRRGLRREPGSQRTSAG